MYVVNVRINSFQISCQLSEVSSMAREEKAGKRIHVKCFEAYSK